MTPLSIEIDEYYAPRTPLKARATYTHGSIAKLRIDLDAKFGSVADCVPPPPGFSPAAHQVVRSPVVRPIARRAVAPIRRPATVPRFELMSPLPSPMSPLPPYLVSVLSQVIDVCVTDHIGSPRPKRLRAASMF
jgi:hypothetical protein